MDRGERRAVPVIPRRDAQAAPAPQRPCRISRRDGPVAGHRAQEELLIRPRTPLTAEVQHVSDPRGRRDLPVERGRRLEDYEYQIITVPRGSSIGQVRAELAEQAEYGRWEHARTRLYMGGGKKVWMRRRIIRVQSTL